MNRKLRLKLNLCRHMRASGEANVASEETSLFNDCYRTVAPAAGVHEVQQALVELEQENRCIKTIGDTVTYSLTARGQAFLAEHG